MSERIREGEDETAETVTQAGKKAWTTPVLECVDLATLTKAGSWGSGDGPFS